MAATLPKLRIQRDIVGCGTPTSRASCVALGAPGIKRRWTIFRLNDSEYVVIESFSLRPHQVDVPASINRSGRATTSLTRGAGARQTTVIAMETLMCVPRTEANTGAKAVVVLEAGAVVANAATSTWLVKDVVEGDGREELLLAFSPGTFQGAEVEDGAVLSFNGALSKETPLGNVVNDSCSSLAPTTRDYAVVVAVPSGSGMRLETSRRSVACPPPSP